MLIKLATQKTVSDTANALQAAVQANHFGRLPLDHLAQQFPAHAAAYPGDQYALIGPGIWG